MVPRDVGESLLFVGVGLAERGLFGEIDSDSDGDESLAQTGRRTTALTLDPWPAGGCAHAAAAVARSCRSEAFRVT